VKSNWMKINRVVFAALDRITLAEMTHPLSTGVAPVEWKGASRLATAQKG